MPEWYTTLLSGMPVCKTRMRGASVLMTLVQCQLLLGATCGATSPAAHPIGASQRPHIVFVMADVSAEQQHHHHHPSAPTQPNSRAADLQDLGHGNVGWHRKGPQAVPEVQTPAMDSLVAEGVALERVYSYACCSPTRSSFVSGRLPIHVNILNTDPASFNTSTGEGAGIATYMTGIGAVLARGNYTTAVVGKWDGTQLFSVLHISLSRRTGLSEATAAAAAAVQLICRSWNGYTSPHSQRSWCALAVHSSISIPIFSACDVVCTAEMLPCCWPAGFQQALIYFHHCNSCAARDIQVHAAVF